MAIINSALLQEFLHHVCHTSEILSDSSELDWRKSQADGDKSGALFRCFQTFCPSSLFECCCSI